MEIGKAKNTFTFLLIIILFFSCESTSHIECVSGKVLQYNKATGAFSTIYLYSNNTVVDSSVIHFNSKFSFDVSNYLKEPYLLAKYKCCHSDTLFLNESLKNHIDLEIKIQISSKCTDFESDRKNCLMVNDSSYYINYFNKENYYEVERGVDILMNDSIRLDYYYQIEPKEYYSLSSGDSIKGEKLIELSEISTEKLILFP